MAYTRKTQDVWLIQGYHAHGWETETEESTWKEAKAQAKCYRENVSYPIRIKKSREPIAQAPPPAATLVETVDGEWMILIHGFQWGGSYDASGAGNATFKTPAEAEGAWKDTGHTEPLGRE